MAGKKQFTVFTGAMTLREYLDSYGRRNQPTASRASSHLDG
jgi:hypothetical protein